MTNPTPVLIGDAAKVAIGDDEFGLAEMATSVAAVLTSRITADGYVFGIEGEWGSGKTTLVNFVCAEITKTHPVVHRVIRFEPWLIGRKEGLLRTFFAALIGEIADVGRDPTLASKLRAKRFDLQRLSDKIQQYATYLDAAAGAIKAGAPLDPSGYTLAGAIIAQVAAFVLRFFKKHPVNLVSLRDEIISDLQTLKNLVPGLRFTVLIDDMDRLEPTESVELLRLVKSVANFPLLTYLVCFDKKILSNHVQRIVGVGNGDDYLEKIFQNTLPVPPQEPFALRRFLRQRLSKSFPDQMGQSLIDDRDIEYRRHLLFDQWCGQLIHTPRDVIRLYDAVALGWPFIEGHGDFFDYVWLQLVKLKSPALYVWIREYLSSVGAYRDGGHAGNSEPEQMAKRLSDLMRQLGWNKYAYLSGIDRFLPGVDGFTLEGDNQKVFKFGRTDLAEFEKGRRLGSPSHWRQYFAFDVPTYAVRDAELAAFRDAAVRNDGSAADMLRSFMARPHDRKGHFVEVLLERLLATSLQVNERKAIIMTFVDVMDELGVSGKGELGRINVWEEAEKFWGTEVADVFEAALQSGESISWLAGVLRTQGFAHGRPEPSRGVSEPPWLTEEQLNCAIAAAVERFTRIGLPELFKKPEPLGILYCWLQLGTPGELQLMLAAAIENNEIFLGALKAMQSWSSSDEGIRHPLLKELVADFMDADAAKLRLEQLARGGNNDAQAITARNLFAEWKDRRF